MKYIVIFLLLPLLAFSQSQKGVSPVETKAAHSPSGSTYAVVVGISDYQDKDIPDLRFADKDAEAFANFLRSPAGGSLDGDHLKVLTNTQATAGRIAEALDALIEKAKKDDQVIIYFSGHGDVEGKKISQPGFLLCWDAPSRVYMGGGTYSLSFLQEVVSTLSVQNQAKVIVITDACHAGKLAGSQIGGAQVTNTNLAKRYANEVKILSCQANEYSLEGPQWGGGRGVFSYHLVDGMYGLADENKDGMVSLGELDHYLEDHVTAEAAPQSQVPKLLGNKTDRMATVNQLLLADLIKHKSNLTNNFAATESRGFEEEILLKADTNIQFMYKAFKLAVQEKRFLAPENDCAEKYYAQLAQVQILTPLRGIMKRNYAAALQDDAQQVINTMLRTGLTEVVLSGAIEERLYEKYPLYLARAAELLGPEHYLYRTLKARQYFFNGKTAKTRVERKANFNQALAWEPSMPHAFLELGVTEGFENMDSAKIFLARASELLPNWVLPLVKLYGLQQAAGLKEAAVATLDRASLIDSTSVLVWYEKALLNMQLHFYDIAQPLLEKVIQSTSEEVCFPCAHAMLGRLHAQRGRPKESLVHQKAAAAIYKNDGRAAKGFCNPCAYVNSGIAYWQMDSLEQAADYFKKAIEVDSNFIYGYQNLGVLYAYLKNIEGAEKNLKKSIQMRPNDGVNYHNLGEAYLMVQRYPEAEAYLLQGIQRDTTNPNTYICLGDVYRETGRYQLSERNYKSALLINAHRIESMLGLGMIFTINNRWIEAEQWYLKVLQEEPKNSAAPYGLAALFSLQKERNKAYDFLEMALQHGFKNLEKLEQDKDLAYLRVKERRWKTLLKKHFPNQFKD